MESSNFNLDNKCVLMTGIAGFIGSNCMVYFVQKYTNTAFIGIDKISYCSDIQNLDPILNKSNFKFIKCDLTDLKSLGKVFKNHKIDVIIHLAAYTHVDLSFGNSIEFTKNNILGTHNLAEYARINPVERFIHISTDEVYGSKNEISTENTMLDPTNPYAATKAAAEHILKSYHHSFGLPLIITRGNNVYGPNQYPDKLIPLFILKLIRGEKCTIHGTGNNKRSFLYVDDCVKAFEAILLKGKINNIYNISSYDELSVMEVTEKLVNILRPGEKTEDNIILVKDRPFNDHRYNINSKKLSDLGWKQTINFELGIKKTIKWYSERIDRW